jgi:hypothetical protein
MVSGKRSAYGRNGVQWVGLVFLAFAAGGLAFLLWSLDGGTVGQVILGGVVIAGSGYAGLASLCPRLLVDDRGVHWRKQPWQSGRVEWSGITDVKTTEHQTSWGGGLRLCSAELVKADGSSVVVARGTLFQPWNKGELADFASVVQRMAIARR